MSAPSDDDSWELAGRRYRSRLLLGTGKYRSFEETARAVAASGAEMVTVAVRRTNIGQDPQSPNLLDHLPREGLTILPNTAGCTTAAEAVRTARLGRELLDGSPLVKLEVIGDEATLYPDDWAGKGPALLGVRAVIAESFERIHRSNLIGMGILPLQFQQGETASSLGLDGRETYDVPADLDEGTEEIEVVAHGSRTIRFRVRVRLDTPMERTYYRHGGILPYVLRQKL
jgi:hypothetical protein